MSDDEALNDFTSWEVMEKYGISNMEELLSLTSFNNQEKEVMGLFGVEDEDKWNLFTGFAKTTIGDSGYDMILNHTPTYYPLGFVIASEMEGPSLSENIPFSDYKFDAATLPPEANLIPFMSGIRSQGGRGTCVAHACLSMYEYHYNHVKQEKINLSEQFLYWWCKENDGIPDKSGTYIQTAFNGLQNAGVCKEAVWRYVSDPITNNESQGPPPDGAIKAAEEYKIDDFQTFDNKDPELLCSLLADGKCLVFAVPIFDRAWHNFSTQRYGKVFMPLSNDRSVGGHAMALVGYKKDAKSPGGGIFIFRNSWGEAWATESPYGSGYGTIPFAYITEHGYPVFTLSGTSVASGGNSMALNHFLWHADASGKFRNFPIKQSKGFNFNFYMSLYGGSFVPIRIKRNIENYSGLMCMNNPNKSELLFTLIKLAKDPKYSRIAHYHHSTLIEKKYLENGTTNLLDVIKLVEGYIKDNPINISGALDEPEIVDKMHMELSEEGSFSYVGNIKNYINKSAVIALANRLQKPGKSTILRCPGVEQSERIRIGVYLMELLSFRAGIRPYSFTTEKPKNKSFDLFDLLITQKAYEAPLNTKSWKVINYNYEGEPELIPGNEKIYEIIDDAFM